MNIIQLLISNRNQFSEVIKNIRINPTTLLDLTENNKELKNIEIQNPAHFEEYIIQIQKINNVNFSIGKYNENRIIYDHSNVYKGMERRSVHIGNDIWIEENTQVFAPYNGVIHSFNFNDNIGDYGPTIILEHDLQGYKFYTLYGHLSLDSLENIKVGQEVQQGKQFCKVGNYPINGNWAPHLHFQIITDMGNYKGDFPGVCKQSEIGKYKEICPNPNIILQIPQLEI